MSRFRLFLLISLVALSCSRTYNVTTDSMSNTFNAGQVLELKTKQSIARGDAVFFSRDNTSAERKETWLFRVIAFSGDTVEIKDGNVLVNNTVIGLPENARVMYSINTSLPLDIKSFRNNTINQIAENRYIGYLTMGEFATVSKLPGVSGTERIINSSGNYSKGIVRNVFTDNWNEDQFGPFYIPKSGEKIKISQANIGLYTDILPDMQQDSTVTIKEKLYFLMGDNRSNAFDSRFIGLVKESNILGFAEEKQ